MTEFPYIQNIVFIWAKTIIPPIFVTSLFLMSRKPSFGAKAILKFFAVFFLFVLLTSLAKSYLQFSLWKENPATAFLLPPYDPFYFYNYAFFRFFLSDAIAFTSGILVGAGLWLIHRYSHGLILDTKEVLLSSLLSFVIGWPGVILFIAFVFLGMFVWQVGTKLGSPFFRFIHWRERVSMTPFLFANALFLLFASGALIDFFRLHSLRITS